MNYWGVLHITYQPIIIKNIVPKFQMGIVAVGFNFKVSCIKTNCISLIFKWKLKDVFPLSYSIGAPYCNISYIKVLRTNPQSDISLCQTTILNTLYKQILEFATNIYVFYILGLLNNKKFQINMTRMDILLLGCYTRFLCSLTN